MRQHLLAALLLLSLNTSIPAASQSHRHTPRNEQTGASAASNSNKPEAIEAFSDTTAAVETTGIDDYQDYDEQIQVTTSTLSARDILNSIDADDLAGMVFALLVLLIIFVLAPIGVLIALFYLLRNKRSKYAPTSPQEPQAPAQYNEYQTGLRQVFLGIGLMIFLGFIAGKVGIGIGALVFFIGLGKVVIARTSDRPTDNFPNT